MYLTINKLVLYFFNYHGMTLIDRLYTKASKPTFARALMISGIKRASTTFCTCCNVPSIKMVVKDFMAL